MRLATLAVFCVGMSISSFAFAECIGSNELAGKPIRYDVYSTLGFNGNWRTLFLSKSWRMTITYGNVVQPEVALRESGANGLVGKTNTGASVQVTFEEFIDDAFPLLLVNGSVVHAGKRTPIACEF